MRFATILMTAVAACAAAPVLAASFDRPIPQAQSATAELWFAIAAAALIVALVAVKYLVSRR